MRRVSIVATVATMLAAANLAWGNSGIPTSARRRPYPPPTATYADEERLRAAEAKRARRAAIRARRNS